jgi:hypothetical protein
MNKKYLSILTSVCALGALSVTYTQCGKSAHLFGSSKQEQNALQQPVFEFTDHGPVTGVVDDDDSDPTSDNGDSYTPSNPYKPDQDPFKWVTSCNDLEAQAKPAMKEAYIQKVSGDSGVIPGVDPYANISNSREFEMAVVKKIVEDRIKAIKAGQQLPLLIPVEFTFSTGDKHDKISYMAYRRSILRNDHDGISYLPTGKHTYVVEHDVARSHFIDGRFKYYSFVEVKSIVANGESAFRNFVKGQPFDAWIAYNMHLEASGLKNIQDYVGNYDKTKELPMGRLFLADVRDQIVPNSNKVGTMYEDVAVGGRNSEVTRRLKDIFNMKNIYGNNNILTHAYSIDRTITDQKFTGTYAGYAGMPQLMHKMNCDVGSSSSIAAQYTPIVLDLGEPFIRTSSEYWGTFFNLADARIVQNDKELPSSGENTFSHRTAWVGGTLKKVPNPALNNLSPAETVVPYKEVWQRVADDGFLVLPDLTKQLTAANLFGASFVNPEKPEEKYDDGFKALQDYAGTKDGCAQPMPQMSYTGQPTEEQLSQRYEEIKKRYMGPWNEKFFNLKIWVDENRDGNSQATEIKSLIEAGVLALNTCLSTVSEVNESDKFGNNTKLRSAFLYNRALVSSAAPTEGEINDILRTLALGKNSSGEDGNFRLMVDIFFKARPFHFLERSLKYRESKDKNKYRVKIKDQIYEEDDASVPLQF